MNLRGQLETIEQQLPAVHKEFRQAYIAQQQNKEEGENDRLVQAKYNLQQLHNQLAQLSIDATKQTVATEHSLRTLEHQIGQARELNTRLVRRRGRGSAENQAAEERMEDYQEEYRRQYWTNWIYMGNIVGLLWAMRQFNNSGNLV